MDYRSLHMKTVADLRKLAKEVGAKLPAGANKALIVELILEKSAEPAQPASVLPEITEDKEVLQEEPKRKRGRPRKNPLPEEIPAPDSVKVMAEVPVAEVKTAPGNDAQEQTDAKDEPTVMNAETELPANNTQPETEDVLANQPVREYHRQLSTQQRMGARTQPQQGLFRPQNGRMNPVQQRMQNNYRRPMNGEAGVQNGYRRPVNGEGGMQNNYRRPVYAEEAEANETARTVPPEENTTPNFRRFTPDGNVPQPYRRSPNEENAPYFQRNTGDEAQRSYVRNPETGEVVNANVPDLMANNDCGDGEGILEIHPDGYGFLRAENYLPGNRDVYVSATQIRRFNLRTGDHVTGKTRAQQMGDRSVGLIYVNEVNGQSPDLARRRRFFDSLVPVYPDERLRLTEGDGGDFSLRLIDMIAPIGKGQRGMIVSQPKAGKTTLLKKVANAITANNPEVHLIVLLIDERPEEVTDMKRSIQGEVVYSTFDEAPENHTRVSEMVLERAQRLVELGKDVVILLDSITRLARAYNLVIPPTGRSLSGGLDPGALHRPKRFFGAARNIENGGSLTIIATALVDTGSRMDDIIFEEFKGTGNMELHLDRSLSDRRIFPAIDLHRSGTRREELLLNKEELDGVYQARRMLSKGSPQEAAENLISMMEKTKNNAEFFQKIKGWMNVCEKDGFSMR